MKDTSYEDQCTLMEYLAEFILEWETFQAKVVERIKADIFLSLILFPEHLAVYEVTWKVAV